MNPPTFASSPISKSVEVRQKFPVEVKEKILREIREEEILSVVQKTILTECFEREKVIQKVISDKWLGIIDYLLRTPLELGCPLLVI